MTVDKPEHQAFLFELLTSKSFVVPAPVVDLYVEVREAVRNATVGAVDARTPEPSG